ncbi:hypothetical protein V5799_023157 [Amblyomma americanum]|uniref:Uncharacterized protein n=1 Tax=Amblyomma americanum TaxID=6943 RepID=A0AAQ4FIG2_AMBAM
MQNLQDVCLYCSSSQSQETFQAALAAWKNDKLLTKSFELRFAIDISGACSWGDLSKQVSIEAVFADYQVSPREPFLSRIWFERGKAKNLCAGMTVRLSKLHLLSKHRFTSLDFFNQENNAPPQELRFVL